MLVQFFLYKDTLLRGHQFGLKFSLHSTHYGPFVVVLPGDGMSLVEYVVAQKFQAMLESSERSYSLTIILISERPTEVENSPSLKPEVI